MSGYCRVSLTGRTLLPLLRQIRQKAFFTVFGAVDVKLKGRRLITYGFTVHGVTPDGKAEGGEPNELGATTKDRTNGTRTGHLCRAAALPVHAGLCTHHPARNRVRSERSAPTAWAPRGLSLLVLTADSHVSQFHEPMIHISQHIRISTSLSSLVSVWSLLSRSRLHLSRDTRYIRHERHVVQYMQPELLLELATPRHTCMLLRCKASTCQTDSTPQTETRFTYSAGVRNASHDSRRLPHVTIGTAWTRGSFAKIVENSKMPLAVICI